MTTKKYRKPRFRHKYNTGLCNDTMTFEDCEIAILRNAVDETEKIQGEQIANNEDVIKIIEIVEKFIVSKKLLCYGGTAINNILPKEVQFYNRDVEIPDYDFFSPNAVNDAKQLADIYYKEGYKEVEAKAGVHAGTYKVFVNFIPIADITNMNRQLFENISKESIEIDGIRYAPPNYLRMAVYLELSRPMGDVSRWEKVIKRLNLLNKYYPLVTDNCQTVDFQRKMEETSERTEKLYYIVRDSLVDQKVVFFGGYATSLYSRYMPPENRKIVQKIPDFDVLAENIDHCAETVKDMLTKNGFTNVKIIKNREMGEIIPAHNEIRVGKETIAFIYKPTACHSYNSIQIDGKNIFVATIDTILAFYLAFIYADDFTYYRERLLCMAKFLFEVEEKNRLEQKGLLKRFSIQCFGEQETLATIRNKKTNKYRELLNSRDEKEFEMWFLKYRPGETKRPPREMAATVAQHRAANKTAKKRGAVFPTNNDFLLGNN
jgi:hypothetical protein